VGQKIMQSKKLAKKSIKQSTQLFLDIAEIKNDTVVLKDGTLRSILLVSSVNFALKSEEEQNALVGAYVNFLNSMSFPIQIVIQSRKLDIDGYMRRLQEAKKGLTNELLRQQIISYENFVQELVEMRNIMSKKFFVIVAYSPLEDKKRGFFARLGSVFTPGQVIRLEQKKFEKYKYELDQRVEHVNMHLNSMDVQALRLDTQSLIELYYNVYNPDVARSQKMLDVEDLRLEG